VKIKEEGWGREEGGSGGGVLFGRHATPLAPPHPSQNPREMTPVHRAINSVFFFSVRCDRVSYFLSFTAVGSASILRVISAQWHVQCAACCGFEEKRS
jgi:hypothetical protein